MKLNLFNQPNEPHTGKVLLAEPFMEDQHFRRSVVFLCEHNQTEGTFGLILNKPLNMKLQEAVPDIALDSVIRYGGPVQPNTLHYLHTLGSSLEGSVEVKEGLFWGGDFEQLQSLANMGIVKEDDVRFFLGYSGWEQNQLDEELQHKSWIVTECEAQHVFYKNGSNLWRSLLEQMGGDYKIASIFPEDPSLN